MARQFEQHSPLRQLLEYVRVSILGALILPAVLALSGQMELPASNIYPRAAVVTSAVLTLTNRPWLEMVGVARIVVSREMAGRRRR